MQLNIIKKEIEKINESVLTLSSKMEWFNFQFSLIQEGMIRLEGSFDLTALYKKYDKIEIEFCNPTFIQTILYGWELQKEKPFIELVTQEEGLEELRKQSCILNTKDYVFRIQTDRNEPVLIIAKAIKFSITKAE